MNSEPEGPVERGVPRSVRHRNWIIIGLVGVLTTLLVVAMIVAGVALSQLADLRDQGVRRDCSDRLIADYAAATGRALAAPPAPNAERVASVTDIKRAAARLARSNVICAAGVPAPLVPTPISGG